MSGKISTTIVFDWFLGQHVMIDVLGVEGVVYGLYHGNGGPRVEISYVENGALRNSFFYPSQVSPASVKPGFGDGANGNQETQSKNAAN